MKYKMTYPQFLIFHEFIVDLNFFNFIIMPKSGVGVKSNTNYTIPSLKFHFLTTPQYIPEKVQSVPGGYFFLPKFARMYLPMQKKCCFSVEKARRRWYGFLKTQCHANGD